MRFLFVFILVLKLFLSANQSFDEIAKPGFCYSILTDVDFSTPVSENYFQKSYIKERCTLFDKPPLFAKKEAYVGCYKKKKSAEKRLKTLRFNFKNPKIVLHRVYDGTPYVIFPKDSTLNLDKALKHLNHIYKTYTIENVLRKFPTKFNGSTLEIYDLKKIDFLPSINLCSIYKFNGDTKVLILRDGDYSIESIYRQLRNDNYLQKIGKKTYEIKIPIVVMPTASLTIKNKTIRLETLPKSIFIMYYGNIYASNSKFLTWDIRRDKYCPREKVPYDKILYTNYEKPRPYFLGLQGSKGYFVNNIFRGLGFHSTSATFGLSVLSPKRRDYYFISQSFYYFIHSFHAPTGAYIGNDIYDGIMAIYTNGAKNIVYLGNYAHDNIIYNFDPHDYSTGLVIARNLSVGAKKAHGIIMSRGCDNNYIAENISIKNNANGVMLDRQSDNNLIYNNLVYGNGFMGISSSESKNILVKNNVAVGNNVDGIMVRNTLKFSADGNDLRYNAKNGIEVMTKNIDYIPGRNFARDPYAKAASSVVSNNSIKNNYNSNIMVKNGAAIKIKNNNIPNNIGIKGDLNFFYQKIIQNRGNFTLYGLGYPYKAISTDLLKLRGNTYKTAKKIFLDIAKSPNDYFGTHLASLYIKKESINKTKAELVRAASRLSKGALQFLGYIYLTEAKKENYISKKKLIDGISYVIEEVILSNDIKSYREIEKIRLFIPNGEYYIKKAFYLAKSRMSRGFIFDKESYNKCYVCKQSLLEKNKIIEAFKIFDYNYKQVRAKSFLDYCQILFKNYTIFTISTMNRFDSLIHSKNIVKERVNRYNRKIFQLANKDKICSRYLKKKVKDFRKAQLMMKNEKNKMLEFIKPKIKELLRKINEYRIRKISYKELLKIIQDDKIHGFKNMEEGAYYE